MRTYFKNIIPLIIIPFVLLIYYGCGESRKDHPANDAVKTATGKEGRGNVKAEKKVFFRVLEFQGRIENNPHSLTDVCVPLGGYVKKLNFLPGDHVKKGAVLAEVSNPEYVLMQKEYHEIKNKLAYYQQDFKRQGELTIENAASVKTMQKAQSEYRSTEASLLANIALLEFLGIEAGKLDEDSIFSTISLRAPVSGYISKLNGHAGKFMEKEIPLYEITGYGRPMVIVSVKGKDLHLVNTGDTLQVILPGDKIEKGVIWKIIPDPGKVNAFKAHVNMNNIDGYMAGLEFRALFTLDSLQSWALPLDKIQRHENESFVLITRGTGKIKIPVKLGSKQDGFVEIIQPDSCLLP